MICAAAISIGAIGVFPSPGQASTTREKFFYGLGYVLNKEPRSSGDESALQLLAGMNSSQKEKIYGMGKTYCAAILRKGGSSDKYLAMIKKTIVDGNYSSDTKEMLWALRLAIASAAKYAVCPD